MIRSFERNKIYFGNVLETMRSWPDGFISCVFTSPPYWALRKYRTEPVVWDVTDPACVHEWGEVDVLRKASPGDIPGPNSILRTSVVSKSILRTNNWSSSTCLNGMDGAYGETLKEKTRQTSELRPGEASAFCTKCGAWRGHLGLEPSPDLFMKHLCDIFDEIKRCLRDDGVVFVNIGDCYGNGHGDGANPSKCLNMIPERFAFEMVRRGWILRDKIPWLKAITRFKRDPKTGELGFQTVGSCMPASVTDRFTSCWEPVFMFTKSQKYWFERQFVPLNNGTKAKVNWNSKMQQEGVYGWHNQDGGEYRPDRLLGANMRGAWLVNTSKTTEHHLATFPVDLCRPAIRAGCPKEICTKCGKPRYPVVVAEGGSIGMGGWIAGDGLEKGFGSRNGNESMMTADKQRDTYKRTLQYTDCGCGAPFRPGIVFDPFMGTGTTAVAAIVENRDWLGTELSPEYLVMAHRRLSNVAGEIGAPERKKLARLAMKQKLQKLEAFE